MNTTAKPLDTGAVPWYRQTWFCIACVVVFPPALIPVLLTGPLYYRKDGRSVPYSRTAKLLLFAWILLTGLYFVHGVANDPG
jgi:hypothetical protein